jgi:hypothetical protein
LREPTSLAIVAGRALLLSVAIGAVVVALLVRRPPDASVLYACPMHPEVTARAPGDCPICRMALEPAAGGAAAGNEARRAAGTAEPAALRLTQRDRLHAFDSVSLVKPYGTALEMRAVAWADGARGGVALLHTDESELVEAGEVGRFQPSTAPRDGAPAGIEVEITAAPRELWDAGTRLVRFRARAGAPFVAGQTGALKLATRVRRGLVVRAPAILHGPEGPYVLVVSDDRRTLTKRPVEIGNILFGYAAVTGGLRQNELVAAKRTFFLDAERRRSGGVAP